MEKVRVLASSQTLMRDKMVLFAEELSNDARERRKQRKEEIDHVVDTLMPIMVARGELLCDPRLKPYLGSEAARCARVWSVDVLGRLRNAKNSLSVQSIEAAVTLSKQAAHLLFEAVLHYIFYELGRWGVDFDDFLKDQIEEIYRFSSSIINANERLDDVSSFVTKIVDEMTS